MCALVCVYVLLILKLVFSGSCIFTEGSSICNIHAKDLLAVLQEERTSESFLGEVNTEMAVPKTTLSFA